MGSLLWEVASGPQVEPEVDSDEETTIFHRETSADIVARNLGNAARKGLLRICERALSSDPAARFASAAEMQWEVEGVLRELGTPITSGEVQEYVGNLFAEERARLKHLLTVQFAKGGAERDDSARQSEVRRAKPPSAMEVARAREIVRDAPYDTMAPTSLEAPTSQETVTREEELTREAGGPASSIRAALASHRALLFPLFPMRSTLWSHAKMVRRAWLPVALIAATAVLGVVRWSATHPPASRAPAGHRSAPLALLAPPAPVTLLAPAAPVMASVAMPSAAPVAPAASAPVATAASAPPVPVTSAFVPRPKGPSVPPTGKHPVKPIAKEDQFGI
jgi:hypothetical protein